MTVNGPGPDFLKVDDWLGKSEPTVCSQLVMPVLQELGYGEHTLHKVLEQQTYTLKDPNIQKGSKRQVRLDYQPRVYEEGLWIMEVKGTDEKVRGRRSGRSATTRSTPRCGPRSWSRWTPPASAFLTRGMSTGRADLDDRRQRDRGAAWRTASGPRRTAGCAVHSPAPLPTPQARYVRVS